MRVELGHIYPAFCKWASERPQYDGWQPEDSRTLARSCIDGTRLVLTVGGHYLVSQSNSWMFMTASAALEAAEIIAKDRGGWA